MATTLNETPIFIMNRANTVSTGSSVYLDGSKRYKVSAKFNGGFGSASATVYIKAGQSEGNETINIARFDFSPGDESFATPELDPHYSYITAQITAISSPNSSVTVIVNPVQ